MSLARTIYVTVLLLQKNKDQLTKQLENQFEDNRGHKKMYIKKHCCNRILLHQATYCDLKHTLNFKNSFPLKKKQKPKKQQNNKPAWLSQSYKKSYVTYNCQLLMNSYHTSNIPILRKLLC